MDRHDVRCILAMLTTSVGIGLNMVFLQAMSGTPQARWILLPVFAGLAISATGVVEHMRRGGRGMVFVERVWIGSLAYVSLSFLAFLFFQPPSLQGSD